MNFKTTRKEVLQVLENYINSFDDSVTFILIPPTPKFLTHPKICVFFKTNCTVNKNNDLLKRKNITNLFMELSINKNIHPNELIQMHFALGKAYESNNQFNKSFNHYRKGNWLQRKQIKYNAEDYKISHLIYLHKLHHQF